ncbi:hypothetical protein LZ31DRAFT_135502 [Colletotrichum somersetense]|nr:hypothetical protein LZ31DRAFT_135502 [Colletotrichum somersetense]
MARSETAHSRSVQLVRTQSAGVPTHPIEKASSAPTFKVGPKRADWEGIFIFKFGAEGHWKPCGDGDLEADEPRSNKHVDGCFSPGWVLARSQEPPPQTSYDPVLGCSSSLSMRRDGNAVLKWPSALGLVTEVRVLPDVCTDKERETLRLDSIVASRGMRSFWAPLVPRGSSLSLRGT